MRTILIGAELLQRDRALRDHAVRVGVIIHFSDATAAVMVGLRRQLPARAAAMAAIISTVNTILAVLAQPDHDQAGDD